MLRAFFRRLLLAASLVVLLAVSLLGTLPAQAKNLSCGVSITKLYTADSSNNPKTVFQLGNTIHYVVDVSNSCSTSITTSLAFTSAWGLKPSLTSGRTMFIQSYTVSFPPNKTSGYYTGQTIPSWEFPGPFFYQAALSNATFTTYTTFTVSGTKYVTNSSGQHVPYYSQFCSSNSTQYHDCGPASVAMVLSYMGKLSSSLTRCQQIAYVRQTIVNQYGNYGDTIGSQLVYALTHNNNGTTNGVQYTSFGKVSPVPYYQENAIEGYLTFNYPAIVLVNASKNIPSPNLGRPYDGHWLVVIGTYDDGTNAYMIVNDPDSNYTGGNTAIIWLPTFGNAIQYVDTESDNYQDIVGMA
jgi:Peptidase_C39 like family